MLDSLGIGYSTLLWVVIASLGLLKLWRTLSDWGFAQRNGCGEVTKMPSYIFGLDILWDFIKATNNNYAIDLVEDWQRKFGRTFQLRLGRKLILTSEPKNFQAILATQFEDFDLGSRNDAAHPMLGDGIFASDGKIWEQSRALLRPNFVRNQIADIAVYEHHVSQLVKCMPVDGSTVDLQDLFYKMTIDSATEFLFGRSFNTLGGRESEASKSFAKNWHIASNGMIIRMRLGPLRWLSNLNRSYTKAIAAVRSFVRDVVQEALEHKELQESNQDEKPPSQSYVFLHELATRTQDEKVLTDQLLNILLAGRDTTAAFLSFTFFLLSRREDVWSKLRAEVLNFDKRPSFEDLKSMKYLTWVMNETLRLYPLIPLNVRMANKRTVLPTGGGSCGTLPIFISKGQEVMYCAYSAHRLPEVYGQDASEFRPERWENLKPGWAYIPFNGGPRICIGQQFALTEASYTIVRILQEFESIESRDSEPFKELIGLTLSMKNGAKVALTPVQT
ncbi:n-alkane-inducible cytochrome P450 [Penicillium malachiteum]|uniref:n-alkane-inducible cytochrome P450 n=1 Tax=Penicillium malachiteum TaxID=1324776 RepID=UPI002546869E|nr:n-alkane-inducible cytochrome P450 [Penicillium malachiteum]KAJ5713476.1 n-alkane-inducible cytochrome P450 [Penicillium malachiteum]